MIESGEPGEARLEPGTLLTLASDRLKSAPTPNNPLTLWEYTVDGDLLRYHVASGDRIVTRIQEAVEQNPTLDISDEAILFIATAALKAHSERCGHLSGKSLTREVSRKTLHTFERSREGSALARELLELLNHCPELVDCELAKQTHPFDWHAAKDMDKLIIDAIKQFMPGARISGVGDVPKSQSKTTVQSYHPIKDKKDLSFITIDRVRLFAELPRLKVYKKSSLLINPLAIKPELEHLDVIEREHDKLLLRKVKALSRLLIANPNGQFNDEGPEAEATNIVGNLIDKILYKDPDERPSYVQPVTTSYFAVAA